MSITWKERKEKENPSKERSLQLLSINLIPTLKKIWQYEWDNALGQQ
jgi:hypothetical protein